jgi:hypothetical protein
LRFIGSGHQNAYAGDTIAAAKPSVKVIETLVTKMVQKIWGYQPFQKLMGQGPTFKAV